MRGEDADVTLHCGSCGKPIVVGLYSSQVQNLVFRCNACSAYNETLE